MNFEVSGEGDNHTLSFEYDGVGGHVSGKAYHLSVNEIISSVGRYSESHPEQRIDSVNFINPGGIIESVGDIEFEEALAIDVVGPHNARIRSGDN